MGLPDGHVDGLVERLAAAGPPGRRDRRRPGRGRAAREGRRSWTGCAPTSPPSPWSPPEPGEAIGAWPPAAHCACRCGARAGWARVAALLAGAGVGEVDVRDGGLVEPWDVAPGGLPAESVGERRDDGRPAGWCAGPRRTARHARPVARTAQGESEPRSLPGDPRPPRRSRRARARPGRGREPRSTSGTPHLYAGVVEATGIVGPLVLPGDTACAGCLDRRRVDRDPAWPRLVAQWRSGHGRAGSAACDLALATAVAGLAASHALAFLDGSRPSSAGARWEVVAAAAATGTRRPVRAHPALPLRRRGERVRGAHLRGRRSRTRQWRGNGRRRSLP